MKKTAPPQISSLSLSGSNPILYWEPDMIEILFTLFVNTTSLSGA
jgi:hypothetical protein